MQFLAFCKHLDLLICAPRSAALPHVTNYAVLLYLSTYTLLLSASSLFTVRVRGDCRYRDNQHNCRAPHVTFHEDEVMSNLHGCCYFITARAADAGATVLVKGARLTVCVRDGAWHRKLRVPRPARPPARPPPL